MSTKTTKTAMEWWKELGWKDRPRSYCYWSDVVGSDGMRWDGSAGLMAAGARHMCGGR